MTARLDALDDRLFAAIRENKEHNEVRRACQASIAAIMGRAAAHTGQVVTWDQAMNSDFRFVADIDGLTFEVEAPIHEGPDGLYPAPLPGAAKEI